VSATRFIAQPVGPERHGDVLRAAFDDQRFTTFWAVVAWAKSSGLRRIRTALENFRARGGSAEIVIGIDERGGTWEGLTLAMSLFDTVYLFHDPGSRTFHPKTYVAEGPNDALALVGSANLTLGGLFTNYEASVVLELDRNDATDGAARAKVVGTSDGTLYRVLGPLRGDGCAPN
jgi:HKD family nuclease